MSEQTQVFDAGTLTEAMSLAGPSEGFDLALLGHTMPGMDGVGGIRAFVNRFPSAKVVLLTAAADSVTVLDAMAAGAHGIISKAMSGFGVQHALRLVLAGETYLPSDVIIALASSNVRPSKGLSFAPPCCNVRFSPAEAEVIPLLLDGLPNKLIAQRLNIEEAAAKARLRGVYKKIGAANRAQAVWSLLSLGESRST